MKNIILCLFYAIEIRGFDLKLFNKIGVAIENLEDDLIVTHGYQTIPLRIEMKLPSIESENTEGCDAASDGNFTDTIESATTRFQDQIKKELAEFINLEDAAKTDNSRVSGSIEGAITADDVAANPSLCDKPNIKCKFFPVMDEPQDDVKEYQARACYDSTLGEVNPTVCKIQNSSTVCCAKRASKNSGTCPRESLGESLAVINRQHIRFPDRIHRFNHGDIPASRTNNYCLAMLWVEIDGTRTRIGRFTESRELEPEEDSPPAVTTKQRRDVEEEPILNRTRRSNWQYYTSGGWFTSKYIDDQINQVKDITTADDNELKLAIEKNSKVLLTLQADQQEKEHLRQAICSASKHLSEELVLAELKASQSKLEFKSELMLRSCSSQIVPDQVDSTLLTKLCTSQSNSPHCYGKAVRSIFSCKLTKPLISMEVVGVSMILTMNIPLDESYESFRIHSIGVPYHSDAVDVQTNITESDKKQDQHGSTQPKNNLDVENAIRSIFSELGKSRNRREIATTYHFLRVDSLPNIVVSYENDLISFMDKDCLKTPFGMIADYSNNVVEDSECVRSIFDSSVQRITHYCSVRLESSNYDCQVRHIGQIGYLLSTAGRMDVTDVSDNQKSVFNNKIGTSCVNNVCAITVGKSAKKFKCGRRIYRVGAHDNIKVEVETEKLSKIKITGLTARKSERAEMILSGFNALDRIPMLNKAVLARTGTVSTLLTLAVSAVMSVVCLKYLFRRGMTTVWTIIKGRFIRMKSKASVTDSRAVYKNDDFGHLETTQKPRFNGAVKMD